MQQPSATVDEIIYGRCMQDIMLRFPQMVLQRDLVSGALSDRAKLACKIAQAIPCWIGPGMTPATQVTDTDLAYPFKAFARKSKEKVVSDEGQGVERIPALHTQM